ncbi:Nif11-like leader peptide family natural product precursor [Calothrix sp. FACHB-156]|nr:Nif11-like leader peptide family natural product precursor [Calothrix sp. FACHB-156]
MSLSILEKVKCFLIKLVKDEAFRTQLMSEKTEEVKEILQNSGYIFSKEEFETAAIKILELKELGQFEDLNEEELIGAIGGLTIIDDKFKYWPPKGYPNWPPQGYPRPIPKPYPIPFPRPIDPQPQPLYGIVIDPPVQALYGVVAPQELE